MSPAKARRPSSGCRRPGVAYNYGFAPKELGRIEGLVQEHEAELLKAWHEYFTGSGGDGNS
jgi:hypothetical protein